LNEQPWLRIFLKKKNRVKLIQKKLFDWKIETTYNWECFSSLSEKNHHKSQSTTISLGKVVYGKGIVKNNERHRAAKQKTWTYNKKKYILAIQGISFRAKRSLQNQTTNIK
jgi:hypothetical protein